MSKFKVGDKVKVIAMDFDGDTSLIGMTGEVVSVQASNEDKPGGPDGPWMITVASDDVNNATVALYDSDGLWFYENELELVK